jgi:hypothetical protein
MLISFDNLPLNNDLLRSIYSYGLHKPSELQFDLIKSFLNEIDTVVEKSHYLTEKYESVIIAALQLEGCSLIIVENKKTMNQLYQLAKKLNEFLNRKITQNNIGYKDINIVTLDYFNKFYYSNLINNINFDTEILFNHIFFIDMNENTKEYCYNMSYLKLNQPSSPYTFIFDDNLNCSEYKNYKKYYNNRMNKFELKDLQSYSINTYNEILNTKCIDDIYQCYSIQQAVFYINNINDLLTVYNSLVYKEYPVVMFHENMTMEEQFNTINSFHSGESRICICTDNANIDFLKMLLQVSMNYERISHVIHLDLPKIDKYLLRIPFHIETKHIFLMNMENNNSFEDKKMLEDYFIKKPTVS